MRNSQINGLPDISGQNHFQKMKIQENERKKFRPMIIDDQKLTSTYEKHNLPRANTTDTPRFFPKETNQLANYFFSHHKEQVVPNDKFIQTQKVEQPATERTFYVDNKPSQPAQPQTNDQKGYIERIEPVVENFALKTSGLLPTAAVIGAMGGVSLPISAGLLASTLVIPAATHLVLKAGEAIEGEIRNVFSK